MSQMPWCRSTDSIAKVPVLRRRGRLGPHPRTPGRDRAAAGKVGYYDDDHRDRAVVHFGDPIRSAYVLIQRDHLAIVIGLERERWKRAHPEFCRRMGIR